VRVPEVSKDTWARHGLERHGFGINFSRSGCERLSTGWGDQESAEVQKLRRLLACFGGDGGGLEPPTPYMPRLDFGYPSRERCRLHRQAAGLALAHERRGSRAADLLASPAEE
jgi:hypothetical protein